MSEELPKQYLVMIDEIDMMVLSRVMPILKYLQVQGMPITDNNTHQFLVNPLQKRECGDSVTPDGKA